MNEALLLMFNYNKRSIVVEIIANMINYEKHSRAVNGIIRSKSDYFYFVICLLLS